MNPTALTIDDFSNFSSELWGADYEAFPWQREFALRLCEGRVPDYVAVPTGSGKTTCLDAAVFALAVQAGLPLADRTQGRRIFFIVNRRVIVDEAFERAGKLCEALRAAVPNSVAGRVAAALRGISGVIEGPPLARAQLRGGIYRDRSWASSLLQPMIVCSTVDQAGSRLLFRGYGVTPQAWPIHAALVGQDTLLIIDEAHISRPFIQTLQWVKRYRAHQPEGCETVQLPFQFIQMTATPPADAPNHQMIALTSADYEHSILKRRLISAKLARLVVEPKAKGKVRVEQLAKRLAEEAERILVEHKPRSIAIMVNRVSTARSVAAKIEKEYKRHVALLTGRLRPLDREAITEGIQEYLKTGSSMSASGIDPIVVVSTQCLEVGADLDFDALVSEAASLDSLRQRFGRLNRGGREIRAQAVIVLPGDQDVPLEKLDSTAPCDPLYGNAIPRTWHWLSSVAQEGMVDFGITAMSSAIDSLGATGSDRGVGPMFSPTTDAPVLLPAYLDCWVQTNPVPAADPDVALFLHGTQHEMAEVQVCWRGDLPEPVSENDWADILSLCPPTTAECLPLPLRVLYDWLNSRGHFEDASGDVSESQRSADNKKLEESRGINAFVWRGPKANERFFLQNPGDLRPGDTVVLRVQSGGWSALGHLPDAPEDPQLSPGRQVPPEDIRRVDIAETATASVLARAVLRIHPALWPPAVAGSAAATLSGMAMDRETDWTNEEIKAQLIRLLNDENAGWALNNNLRGVIEHLAKKNVRLCVEPYPDLQGFVLNGRERLPDNSEETDDADSDTLLETVQPQELWDHTKDVQAQMETTLAFLPLSTVRDPLIAASIMHDWGKADPRFQALLRGSTPFAAMASEMFLAKSGSITSSFAARRAAAERAQLPEGFRHELLSVQMAESALEFEALPANPVHRALTLYLIGTHHGYGRPFPPLVEDEAPPSVSLPMKDKTIVIPGAKRLEHPAHALDSGLVDRFWETNRNYGWWGTALLEAILRLADQSASAHSQTSSRS